MMPVGLEKSGVLSILIRIIINCVNSLYVFAFYSYYIGIYVPVLIAQF